MTLAEERSPDWRRRRSAALPFAVIGSACVVAGGLAAALTSAVPSEHGAWAAAYLVLVAGVAQLGLGSGQAWLAPRPPSPGLVRVEVGLLNAGNLAVIGGTLCARPHVVDVGGVLLVLSLVLLGYGVRAPGSRSRLLVLHWALTGLLLVSIPVGLVLARTSSS